MLGTLIDILINTPLRVKKIWQLINDPIKSRSYYIHAKRKSKLLIFLDNILWALTKGEVNHYYFLYGFDRKKLNDTKEYLGHKEFWEHQKKVRESSVLVGVEMSYKCLVHDKLAFSTYLSGLGFSTPKTIAIGNKTEVTFVEEGQTVNLESFSNRDTDAFCKDLLGEGGVDVFPLKIQNGNINFGRKRVTLKEMQQQLPDRWLLQERIEQHHEMTNIYPHSVNTIRTVTALNNNRPELLFANLRVGNNRSACDNWSIGGVMIGLDMDKGILNKYGYLKSEYGTRTTKHPETHFVFEGYKVPFYREAIELALRLHRFFYGIHSIGWDIAITENGPCVLEANDEWLLAMPQGLYGGMRSKYLDTYPEELM